MAADLRDAQVIQSQLMGSPLQLPVIRQLLLLVGLAASVALGVYVAMWSQQPGYGLLYGGLQQSDAAHVIEALQQNNIPYRLDPVTGGIEVPQRMVHEARLKLASSGLPRGGSAGFELMDKQRSFGTSQFIEKARYQRAIEGELSRSIMSMSNVIDARVHLAIPKRSAFARNQQKSTASVILRLQGGQSLKREQVAAIAHMVSASVPGMDSEQVTVVDQAGRLLTRKEEGDALGVTTRQFEYIRSIEQAYMRRIEDLLIPVVGPQGVRAQVSLDMDFTATEQTQESYAPNPQAVRSEQVVEERMGGGTQIQGVPGALSNQPPAPAQAPETAATGNETAGGQKQDGKQDAGPAASPLSSTRRATRNYELGKTISHTRTAPGLIKRLSIAVVVDDMRSIDAAGKATQTPLTKVQIDRIISLVKEAVGFNASRGDTVQVINSSFQKPEPIAPLPPLALWEKPIVWDIGRQILAGILVLILIFAVLRPTLRAIMARPVMPVTATAFPALPAGEEGMIGGASSSAQPHLLPAPPSHESHLEAVRSIAQEDPKRVAQVVKNWVSSDG